jgi:RNA polymerase sigma-70 factor (ECF subfamily)
MEQITEITGLDARVLKHIRCTTRGLARTARLPGMDADDIEQDLLLDLWQRRTAYDPARASFPTFADRVVAHRVATLTCATARIKAERGLVSLDASDDNEDSTALVDSLADPTIPQEDERGLVLDMRRFMASLTPALLRNCDILLAPNLRDAAAQAGLHRSSVYEGAQRLRKLAMAAGLAEYIVGTPTLCAARR